MRELLNLLSVDDARAILGGFEPVSHEKITVVEALGRVVAEPFQAAHDLPREPRSTVDGYAVRANDTSGATDGAPASLELIGQVPMGGIWRRQVQARQAVAISTGGVVPDGADAVVMLEYVDGSHPERIAVQRAAVPGDNVIRAGEDLRAGESIIAAGRRLRPQDIGALAGFGESHVTVFRRPRVAILSTGNEIVSTGVEPAPGQVRDVNQIALAAQATTCGCLVTRAGIVRDDADELRARLAELLETHDAIFLSGGSSVGVRDLAAQVVQSLGAPGVLFHGINVRPGKPTLCARIGRKPVIGMPGFPVSAMVIFDVFMRRLLWLLGGEHDRVEWPAHVPARLGRRHKSAVGREDWLRVRLQRENGEFVAQPIVGGSALLSTLLRADGYVRVEPASEGIEAGERVNVLLFDGGVALEEGGAYDGNDHG